MLNDDVKFFQYFRMSNAKFTTLLDTLSPHILRQNTTYRVAIEPEQRLAVCLRYVLKILTFKYLKI